MYNVYTPLFLHGDQFKESVDGEWTVHLTGLHTHIHYTGREGEIHIHSSNQSYLREEKVDRCEKFMCPWDGDVVLQ